MPKPSGTAITVEADGRSYTLTVEEFERRVREFHRMGPEEKRRFLEREKWEPRKEERR